MASPIYGIDKNFYSINNEGDLRNFLDNLPYGAFGAIGISPKHEPVFLTYSDSSEECRVATGELDGNGWYFGILYVPTAIWQTGFYPLVAVTEKGNVDYACFAAIIPTRNARLLFLEDYVWKDDNGDVQTFGSGEGKCRYLSAEDLAEQFTIPMQFGE